MTTPTPRDLTRQIADRVLADDAASNMRRVWARDVLAALDRGDAAAAARVCIPVEWMPAMKEAA